MIKKQQSDAKSNDDAKSDSGRDEIGEYVSARYLSGPECAWRILGFNLYLHSPQVVRLPVHLCGEQSVIFNPDKQNEVQAALKKSLNTALTQWFALNKQEAAKPLDEAVLLLDPTGDNRSSQDLLYTELPELYVLKRQPVLQWTRAVRPKKSANCPIGRMYSVHPRAGERYYLRVLLLYVTGAQSYEDIRTFDGEICDTFRAACLRRGLLDDDKEWDRCLEESAFNDMPKRMRFLFATILSHCEPAEPLTLWMKFKRDLCHDFLREARRQTRNPQFEMTDEQLHAGLRHIETLLQSCGMSLQKCHLPEPPEVTEDAKYQGELLAERQYDRKALAESSAKVYDTLNAEQKTVFDTVTSVVTSYAVKDAPEARASANRTYFLEAPAGTGKTTVLNALLDRIRSTGRVAIPVASSGIAALLLHGGRTAHSRLRIPINCTDTSMCAIDKRKDALAILLRNTSLLVWDEAPMQNRYIYETVDRTLRFILSKPESLFGGLPFLICGDMAQILPVIPRSSRAQIVISSLTNMDNWKHVQSLKLKINHRVFQAFEDENDTKEAAVEYLAWLDKVGRGEVESYPQRGTNVIRLDNRTISTAKNLTDFVETVFPGLCAELPDGNYFACRGILTPKVVDVDMLNKKVLDIFPGAMHPAFHSADAVDMEHGGHLQYNLEVLHSMTPSGMPPHKLFLKVGAPIMLLRNLNARMGACNGTRLIINELSDLIITATIITGTHAGTMIDIPRIKMSPSDQIHGVPFTRRQFPVRLAFAFTINKAQGQTLKKAGVYLPRPVFTHGQLYVAISRAGHPKNLCVYIVNSDNPAHCSDKETGAYTSNIVYKEVFRTGSHVQQSNALAGPLNHPPLSSAETESQ